jgi:GTP-binding protein
VALAMRFVRSAGAVGDLPPSRSELALVGRSNVGKSSLLNALAGRTNLARTSKTPGATRLLNVFELEPQGSGRWLVDLPGYGYARSSHAERRAWQTMVEGYLIERETLTAVILLLDGEIGPTPLDLQTVEWLDHIDRPFHAVATKSDKVRSSKRPARRAELAGALGRARTDVTWVSARTGAGIDVLERRVEGWLGAGPIRPS